MDIPQGQEMGPEVKIFGGWKGTPAQLWEGEQLQRSQILLLS